MDIAEKIKEVRTRLETSKSNLENTLNNLDTGIDIAYFIGDATSFDELRENIDNGSGFDQEIIYYSNAIKYLTDNDASLRRSMEIASDMGYEVKNLNSEILASLLASEIERERFEELESFFDDYFTELQEINSSLERLDEIESEDVTEELLEELDSL